MRGCCSCCRSLRAGTSQPHTRQLVACLRGQRARCLHIATVLSRAVQCSRAVDHTDAVHTRRRGATSRFMQHLCVCPSDHSQPTTPLSLEPGTSAGRVKPRARARTRPRATAPGTRGRLPPHTHRQRSPRPLLEVWMRPSSATDRTYPTNAAPAVGLRRAA